MHPQNQIKRTWALAESIEIVRTLLNSQTHRNRASLSRAVCMHLNFHDARGRPQIGGCVKALRDLEREGHFVLPAQSKATVLKSPRRLDCAVPNPVAVPAPAPRAGHEPLFAAHQRALPEHKPPVFLAWYCDRWERIFRPSMVMRPGWSRALSIPNTSLALATKRPTGAPLDKPRESGCNIEKLHHAADFAGARVSATSSRGLVLRP